MVGTAASVTEALARFAELRPDVVVTDLQLQDGTGLDIVRALRRDHPEVGLVVLTMHSGDDQIFAAMEAGASGFVGKDAPSDEVVKAARHAKVSPRSFVCAGLVGAMMRRGAAESTRLTDREHEVLMLLADGLGAAAIGDKLYMSESTAKSHIAKIYQKLGAVQPGPGPGHCHARRAAVLGSARTRASADRPRARRSPNGLLAARTVSRSAGRVPSQQAGRIRSHPLFGTVS